MLTEQLPCCTIQDAALFVSSFTWNDAAHEHGRRSGHAKLGNTDPLTSQPRDHGSQQ